MTPLEDLLIRQIAATGPISLADYMAQCLLHPKHGYYATRDPFGAKGDFTTAPEISQMFGELMGLCLAQSWLDQGAPNPFVLAEIGPGRGTLMADILRATRGVAGFHSAVQVWLIEASATLKSVQHQTLAAYPVQWAESVDALPDAPLFLIANEFFDALPIRQFTRDPAGWRETMVGLAQDRLTLGQSAAAPIALLDPRLPDTKPGDVVEICPALPAIVTSISARIRSHGGAAIFIDYGDWRARGDTFQAIENHAFAAVLEHPGAADLTAHVDFEAIARAAAPCPCTAMIRQGDLLARLGIHARAQILAQKLHGAALESHLAATRRLTDPTEMGTLFKALALHAPNTLPPPGFD